MKDAQGKRSVTPVWLISELNFRLKQAEGRREECCGCRVRQVVPPQQADGANWSAELFSGKCLEPCLDHVDEIIRQMQRVYEVAW
jgi:hypothetical protein